jgi:hypothetical protein
MWKQARSDTISLLLTTIKLDWTCTTMRSETSMLYLILSSTDQSIQLKPGSNNWDSVRMTLLSHSSSMTSTTKSALSQPLIESFLFHLNSLRSDSLYQREEFLDLESIMANSYLTRELTHFGQEVGKLSRMNRDKEVNKDHIYTHFCSAKQSKKISLESFSLAQEEWLLKLYILKDMRKVW